MSAEPRHGQSRAGCQAGRFDDPLLTALTLLFRAYCYARNADAVVWDFAVEIQELRRAGLTNSEFRWLLARGYVEHAQETTLPDNEKREFRQLGQHTFAEGTCFVLTAAGVKLASRSGNETSSQSFSSCENSEQDKTQSSPLECRYGRESNGTPPNGKPHWDARSKELRVGEAVVKRFKWSAINQETLLAVFEEEDWPARIDDPLPLLPEQNPKRRLHDAIKCLNRHHLLQLIRFHGDGTGEGIRWELIDGKAGEANK